LLLVVTDIGRAFLVRADSGLGSGWIARALAGTTFFGGSGSLCVRLLAGGLAFSAEQGDLGFEVLEGVKRAVDRREPQVRNFVQLAKRAEDCKADLHGWNLGVATGAQRILDSLGEECKLIVAYRPALTGLAYP
jgi:hypothetical protein